MIPQLRITAVTVILALFVGMLGQPAVISSRVLAPLEEEEKLGAESKSSRESAPSREQSRRRKGREAHRSLSSGRSPLPAPTAAGLQDWTIQAGISPGRSIELLYRYGCGAFLRI